MANSELLHEVLQHIKEHPEEHDAKRWHKDFAGWTLRLAVPGVKVCTDADGIEVLRDDHGKHMWIVDIGPRARKLLELDAEQALKLFCGGNTVDDLSTLVAEFTAEQ